jgi:glycosyltransferase involved in cell wall biosynthesis
MRIGIDASPLGVRFGGICRYTERLIRSLSRIDDRNEYLLYAPAGCHGENGFGRNVAWDEDARFPLRSWTLLLRLGHADDKLDLFHGTNYGAPVFNRFPTVLTVHDLTVQLFPRSHPFARRMRHRMLPLLCRRSSRIIADSYCTKHDLLHQFGIPPEKIQVIYLAAGEEFRPVACAGEIDRVRERYGLPDAFVLFVGSIEPRKNLPVLIRAMAELVREGIEQRLVIAGDGERGQVSRIHRLIREEGLEPGADVILTGGVPEGDLPALYSACAVFVYPSVYEGFGLPPIEAMACGAPVLLPDNSCFRELYQDCGLVHNLGAPELMASAIRRVLCDPALRGELAEQGLKRAKSRTWDDTAAETLEVYRRGAA